MFQAVLSRHTECSAMNQSATPPSAQAPRPVARSFDLIRWFAILSLVSVTAISVTAAWLLSRLITDRMLHHEAVLTREFVDSVVLAEGAPAVFAGLQAGNAKAYQETFYHLSSMPDVLRANVYGTDRRVLWSSDQTLIGRRFDQNEELEEALGGKLVVHSGSVKEQDKEEHVELDPAIPYFVESYIPVRASGGPVLGVVELYKTPRAVVETLEDSKRWIWIGSVLAGLFLYFTLFWIVRRGDNLIREQQDRLVESETLAVVGEMGGAVAHGIRNPLASIRSSAELALEGDEALARESASDIVAEVDRLERWVRELLSYSRPVGGKTEKVEIQTLVAESMGNFAREMEKRMIEGRSELEASLPPVEGDRMLFAQVLNSVIANAMEATPASGAISVRASVSADRRHVEVIVRDTGTGIAPHDLAKVFKPFYTTKAKGLGVGLPLVKRIVERFGGSILVASEAGKGTTVSLQFRIASAR